MKDELWAHVDKNKDKKIEISELASLLPTDEEFIVLFTHEKYMHSSIDFMRVWKLFDKDHSGYIEANELKDFLKELFKYTKKGNELGEDKLIEYTDNLLRIFDKNKDRRLQLSEMARSDKNGYMEGEELEAFFKDLLELAQEDYDGEDLAYMKREFLKNWDANKDGKICIDELKMIILAKTHLSGAK
ncbi:unnamed protein product [Schistocephalus solidus]|uniref:EF-hand domain-containing protein n=1 Tax=Schistocephalus solidus TaxID=70667 RepID=A0A3P7E7P6_SCHSO|nr:unnamed protein product [Schistocephalus solidus]